MKEGEKGCERRGFCVVGRFYKGIYLRFQEKYLQSFVEKGLQVKKFKDAKKRSVFTKGKIMIIWVIFSCFLFEYYRFFNDSFYASFCLFYNLLFNLCQLMINCWFFSLFSILFYFTQDSHAFLEFDVCGVILPHNP